MLSEAEKNVLKGHRHESKLQQPPALLDHEPSKVLSNVAPELTFDDKHMGKRPREDMQDPWQGLQAFTGV